MASAKMNILLDNMDNIIYRLMNTDVTFTEIALEYSFQNHTTLARAAIKRHMTPDQYELKCQMIKEHKRDCINNGRPSKLTDENIAENLSHHISLNFEDHIVCPDCFAEFDSPVDYCPKCTFGRPVKMSLMMI